MVKSDRRIRLKKLAQETTPPRTWTKKGGSVQRVQFHGYRCKLGTWVGVQVPVQTRRDMVGSGGAGQGGPVEPVQNLGDGGQLLIMTMSHSEQQSKKRPPPKGGGLRQTFSKNMQVWLKIWGCNRGKESVREGQWSRCQRMPGKNPRIRGQKILKGAGEGGKESSSGKDQAEGRGEQRRISGPHCERQSYSSRERPLLFRRSGCGGG